MLVVWSFYRHLHHQQQIFHAESRPSWCPSAHWVLELNVEPLSVRNITAHYTKIHRSYRHWILDRWTPFVLQRWLATTGLLSVFLLRIVLAQGASLPSILAFQKNDSNSHWCLNTASELSWKPRYRARNLPLKLWLHLHHLFQNIKNLIGYQW